MLKNMVYVTQGVARRCKLCPAQSIRTVTHESAAKHSPGEKGLHKRDWDSREGEKWKLLPYLLARRWVPNILLNLKERPSHMQMKSSVHSPYFTFAQEYISTSIINERGNVFKVSSWLTRLTYENKKSPDMKVALRVAALIGQFSPFQRPPHPATLGSLNPPAHPSLLHSIIGIGATDLSMNVLLLPSGNISSLMNCFNLYICFFDKCDFQLNYATFINSKCWLIRINESPQSCQQKWAFCCTCHLDSLII